MMQSYNRGPAPGTKAFSCVFTFLFGFFAVFGVIFVIAGGFWLGSDKEFFNNAEQTVGTVEEVFTDSDGVMHPIVRYTAEGSEYVQRLNSSSSSFKIGDEIDVFFLADDPQNARADSFSGGIVFIVVGSVFAFAGLIGIAVRSVSKMKRESLINSGERVSSVITDVRFMENITVNGVHPYKIYCDSDRVPEMQGKPFVSKNIYFPVSRDVVGKYISVYVDSKNPCKYIVDTDELKNFSL